MYSEKEDKKLNKHRGKWFSFCDTKFIFFFDFDLKIRTGFSCENDK